MEGWGLAGAHVWHGRGGRGSCTSRSRAVRTRFRSATSCTAGRMLVVKRLVSATCSQNFGCGRSVAFEDLAIVTQSPFLSLFFFFPQQKALGDYELGK